jgi:hypothetical protein
MLHISIDDQLDLLEERFQALASSLIDGNPEVLQSASASLQILAVELVQMLNADGRGQLGASGRSRRVRALAGGLATVRENLFRQSAYVDRALELIVPATQQKSTYSGSRAYGGPVRQSGAFAVLSA